MDQTPELHGIPSSHTPQTNPPSNAGATLTIEWWPIQRPIPYARNPRVVPEAAVAKVAASLAEYGWRQPIVVDAQGVIVVGHTRLLAAKRLGLARCRCTSPPTSPRSRSRPTAWPTTAPPRRARWDLELLPLEVGELADLGYDLDLLGLRRDELARLRSQPSRGPHRSRRGARGPR